MKIATTIGEAYSCAETPAEAVRCYKGTGFRYLDFNFYSFHTGNHPFMQENDRVWKKIVSDAGEAAAECSFKFVQAHAPGYNPLGTVSDHKACMRAMIRSIEACGMLGIPNIVIHTSFSNEHLYPAGKKAYFDYNRGFLFPMLKTAEKYGVNVCIENSTVKNMGGKYFFMTAEEMLDFVDFVKHPLLHCCWDTGHAVLEGKGDQYADLVKLGPHLKAIHLHDNGGSTDQHIAPYCGLLQLNSVVKALKEIRYGGYFTYETDCFMNRNNGNGPLKQLPLELRQEVWRLLYKIAKFALETYDVFEE